jgi:DNA polymerase-3 subunit gamma/tau
VSYLVLARKYRPSRFDDLIGQEHVARTMTNAIALGRVHHAFLFTGARGVGKTSAARILAKALCCARAPTPEPCGICDFCVEIASGQSVDVLEIDGASNTGVDDVRALREGVRYLPAKGQKKVYIIDEVHMLSTAAFNALLKTLEEPPAHVVFVFATTEVHKIPATIMSRCQRYDFKLVPNARIAEHLGSILTGEKVVFEPDGLRLVARQAAGSVRDALSLVDQVIAYAGTAPLTRELVAGVLGVADRRLLMALTEAVVAREPAKALRLMAEAVDRGVDLAQLSRAFLGLVHDIEIVGIVADPADVLDATADELAETKALAQRIPRGLTAALFDRWARAIDEAGRSITSARLILEMALVDLCFAEPLLPLGDLLARLEDLETRVGKAGGGAGIAPRSDRGGGESPPGGARPAADATPARSAPAGKPAVTTARVAAVDTTVTTPASAALASARVANPGDVADVWRAVRDGFVGRPALAAALDHADVGDFSDGRLTLVFDGKFTMDQAEKARADIERALTEAAGTPVRLQLRHGQSAAQGTGAPVLRSEVSREAQQLADDQRRRQEEARQHPMIKRAQELFGATPREIKTP